MSARRTLLALLILVAVGIGAFFGGRASVTTSAVTTTTSPRAAPFSPVSVTFISLDTGWALGTTSCGNDLSCLSLRATTDGGHHWFAESLPFSLLKVADRNVDGVPAATYGYVPNIRFANARNGWIYGSLGVPIPANDPSSIVVSLKPVLWSTHDGGATWKRQQLPWAYQDGPVLDLEAAAGNVFMMAMNLHDSAEVESTPVGKDQWRATNTTKLNIPAGGGSFGGAIVLRAAKGWLVEGNDRGISGSAQLSSVGKWTAWTPPCEEVGDSYTVPAVSTTRDLVALCSMGGFASAQTKFWPRGATFGSNWLYFSNNGGTTFTVGPQLQPSKDYFYNMLGSPSPATVLLSRSNGVRDDLLASFDRGIHWRVVYKGQIVYLGFTSATQGVAIVQSSNRTYRMIMTYDGGRTWTLVTF
ncbi:MAG TPA: hypothetical protein VII65_07555 [Acidimicrobiales bacterium]